MPGIENQMKNILLVLEEALKLDGIKADLIWAEDIVYDQRVTLKCRQNKCSHYGKNFMCPPMIPSSEEIQKSTKKYKVAIILQYEMLSKQGLTKKEMNQEFDKATLSLLDSLISLEKTAFKLGFFYALGFGSGNCKLCEICGAKLGAESCSRPDKARPSMEAVGIDVVATCAKAGLEINFGGDKLSAVGVLYII